MKKIFIINFVIIIFIILFLELFIKFFNFSGLMGIESGLVYHKNNNHHLVPGSNGLIFNTKVYTDNNGYRIPVKSFKPSQPFNCRCSKSVKLANPFRSSKELQPVRSSIGFKFDKSRI